MHVNSNSEGSIKQGGATLGRQGAPLPLGRRPKSAQHMGLQDTQSYVLEEC